MPLDFRTHIYVHTTSYLIKTLESTRIFNTGTYINTTRFCTILIFTANLNEYSPDLLTLSLSLELK